MSEGRFVSVWRVPPPAGKTVMVKFGASVFDAAFSKWQNKWFMLIPGAGEEEIAPPSLWYCKDPNVAPEPETQKEPERVSFRRLTKEKVRQLQLF